MLELTSYSDLNATSGSNPCSSACRFDDGYQSNCRQRYYHAGNTIRILSSCFFALVLLPGEFYWQDVDPASRATGDAADEGLSHIKHKLYEQINRDRQSMGLQPVLFSPELSELADAHCREMLSEGYTSHWNRAGLKPYMRYSLGGITDHTAENISGVKATQFDTALVQVEQEMLARHAGLLNEKPPLDLHRTNILDPAHTHVGIGLAYDHTGMRMIEIFANRYLQVEPLPSNFRLSQELSLKGRILSPNYEVESISIFYDEPPSRRSLDQLRESGLYGFSKREKTLRPKLPKVIYVEGRKFFPSYEDGSWGEIELSKDGSFSCPVGFFEGRPGVYTIVIWLKPKTVQSPSVAASNICLFVTE